MNKTYQWPSNTPLPEDLGCLVERCMYEIQRREEVESNLKNKAVVISNSQEVQSMFNT